MKSQEELTFWKRYPIAVDPSTIFAKYYVQYTKGKLHTEANAQDLFDILVTNLRKSNKPFQAADLEKQMNAVGLSSNSIGVNFLDLAKKLLKHYETDVVQVYEGYTFPRDEMIRFANEELDKLDKSSAININGTWHYLDCFFLEATLLIIKSQKYSLFFNTPPSNIRTILDDKKYNDTSGFFGKNKPVETFAKLYKERLKTYSGLEPLKNRAIKIQETTVAVKQKTETPQSLPSQSSDNPQKAANSANGEAQKKLGDVCYAEKNFKDALSWYNKAANLGNWEAYASLGDCYFYGRGVEKNRAKAFDYYKQAAMKGSANGQAGMATCYYWGEGVAKDLKLAFTWCVKSAQQNHVAAQTLLGFLYSGGQFKDLKKSVAYFRKSAEKEDPEAQYRLGYAYFEGEGVDKDLNLAFEWLQKSASKGWDQAFLVLSRYYQEIGEFELAWESLSKCTLETNSLRSRLKQKMEKIAETDQIIKQIENNTHADEKIDLGDRNINDAQIKRLAAALTKNKKLKHLVLGSTSTRHPNLFGDIGVATIAESLKSNSVLEILDLSHTKIGDKGALALGEVLSQNKSLKKLLLNSTHIKDEGAQYLAKGLKNSSLIYLEITNSEITDAVVKSFYESLWYAKLIELKLNYKIDITLIESRLFSNKCNYYASEADYDSYLSLAVLAENTNDSLAQYCFAELCEKGYRRENKKEIDLPQAVKFYKKSAEQNYSLARQHLETLAENGNQLAQVSLGDIYENGRGVMQDLKIAFKWFQKGNDLQGCERVGNKLLTIEIAKKLVENKNESAQGISIINQHALKTSQKDEFIFSFSIDYKELTFTNVLGKGGFGVVHLGTYRHNNVAIKQLHVNAPTEDAIQEFKQEMEIMARLRCPQIVTLYGIYTQPSYGIVMEYLSKGSLHQVLHSKEKLDWSIGHGIALDITCGLAFLHRENIFHRDLKSLNILLDDRMHAKLTDFGLSKMKNQSAMNSGQIVGTLQWMAPELYDRKPFTNKSDIYSLGMTFWEIISRKAPFEEVVNQGLIKQWVTEGIREDIPADCPTKFAHLIKCCWSQKPEDRPTGDEVVLKLKSFDENSTKISDYRDNFSSYRPPSLQGQKSYRPPSLQGQK